ncbi:hypothetical protein CWI42_010110 [Ordospora colligata]|uniref:Uncharacterized protein n=1 Tax=Ordospora colligata OC4 TaxID=1354746 RepID=A0A0B2UN26_9MICR|nr:uncharacterized protein M896_010110 [Ordospora colligata OC4]KHN70360.1 hypothetical protein M896_010110 [Ordospora colligata OC4]TBU17110.1 hypothetical protein CWI41_010110 [Ordospora colligata]TBU17360.1 hypothetical protein CWI40_010110 [Ordospora colligata]TBU19540.1 hypothetical protein CWI42_010110 [Ordospora colligata]
MRFNVFVEGDFENIKGVFIAQSYPIRIRCTCGKEHEKNVVISSEDSNVNKKGEEVNLCVTCHECKELMTFKILKLDGQIECTLAKAHPDDDSENVYLTDMDKNRFMVSRIQTNGAEVLSITNCTLNLVSDDGVLFKDVNIREKTVAEFNTKSKMSSIIDFSLVVEQTKH